MIAADEDALICDLAQDYGVFDYKGLSVKLLATLACGLRENSRIKMALSNVNVSQSTMLMAAAVDKLSFLAWAQTADGQKGRNRPKSVLQLFLGKTEIDSPLMIFDTGEDFENARQKILKGE